MSGSIVDALLGRVLSDATELEIRGGLNFTGGLTATAGASNNWNDVKPNFLRLLALGSADMTADATTALTASTWAEISGTFAAGSYNDSTLTLAASGAGLVWGGTETVRAVVIGHCSIDASSTGDTFGLGVAVEGSVIGDYGLGADDSVSESDPPPFQLTTMQLVQLAPGETVSLQLQNATDGDDADVTHLTMAVVVIGEVL